PLYLATTLYLPFFSFLSLTLATDFLLSFTALSKTFFLPFLTVTFTLPPGLLPVTLTLKLALPFFLPFFVFLTFTLVIFVLLLVTAGAKPATAAVSAESDVRTSP